MTSDASQWVDIDLSWELSSKVTEINNGYALNGGNIEADITLTGNQVTNKYGVIFIIANLIPDTIYHTNLCELVCYDEGGSMLNASLTYFKLIENDIFWIEIDIPHKTHRIEYRFSGKFDVTAIQLYGVSTSAVNVATYESVGTVQPDKFQGVKVEADGRIGVNVGAGLSINAEGAIAVTGLEGSAFKSLDYYDNGFKVNGAATFRRVTGGLLHLESNTTIPITKKVGNI